MNELARIEVVDTPRLRLRPLEPDDAEDLTELLQDPTIARWTKSIPWPYAIADAHAYIATRPEADTRGESFVWAIV